MTISVAQLTCQSKCVFRQHFHNFNIITLHIEFAFILLPPFCEIVHSVTFPVISYILFTFFIVFMCFDQIMHSSCYRTFAKSCFLPHFATFCHISHVFPLVTIYFHNSLTFHIHFACILLPHFSENVRFVTFYIILCVFSPHFAYFVWYFVWFWIFYPHFHDYPTFHVDFAFILLPHSCEIMCFVTFYKISYVLSIFLEFFKHYASNVTKYMWNVKCDQIRQNGTKCMFCQKCGRRVNSNYIQNYAKCDKMHVKFDRIR